MSTSAIPMADDYPLAKAQGQMGRHRTLPRHSHRRHHWNAALYLLLRHHGFRACIVLLLRRRNRNIDDARLPPPVCASHLRDVDACAFPSSAFRRGHVEESALKWASQHRQHHLFTDTEHDPYGVNQGFWHAHIGWILFWRHKVNYDNVKDLRRSRLVAHQHDHHEWWSIGGGIVLPMLIAFWIGHPLGG